VKPFAHMARMIWNAELFLDHPSNHRRGPDATIQAVSDRTTVENVPRVLLLLF
jgi:hypothetical protein